MYILTTIQSQILHLGRLFCRTSLASSRSSKLQCTNDNRLSLVSMARSVKGRRPHRLALSLRFKYRRLSSLLILCGISPQRLLRCRSSCLSSCRPHSQSGMTPRRLQFATNRASSLTREAKQAGRGPLLNSFPPIYTVYQYRRRMNTTALQYYMIKVRCTNTHLYTLQAIVASS